MSMLLDFHLCTDQNLFCFCRSGGFRVLFLLAAGKHLCPFVAGIVVGMPLLFRFGADQNLFRCCDICGAGKDLRPRKTGIRMGMSGFFRDFALQDFLIAGSSMSMFLIFFQRANQCFSGNKAALSMGMTFPFRDCADLLTFCFRVAGRCMFVCCFRFIFSFIACIRMGMAGLLCHLTD